jgi:four helix bundle protein
MADYKKLLVWQKAHEMAIEANRLATTIRGANYSSLRSQIIRSAMSVPANIVEGRAQQGEREFIRFLKYSAASASELEYHLKLADDLRLIDAAQVTQLCEHVAEVQRMLRGLMNSLAVACSQ